MDIGGDWEVMLHAWLATRQAPISRDIFMIRKPDPFHKTGMARDLQQGGWKTESYYINLHIK
jgi:hypothetical protein